jgi:hypothetical protein
LMDQQAMTPWLGYNRRQAVTMVAASCAVVAAAGDVPALEPHLRLQRFWSNTRDPNEDPSSSFRTPVPFPAGYPEQQVLALEGNYGVTLPSEFRKYLLLAAPLAENWDTNSTNWWPLDRIRSITDEFPNDAPDAVVAHIAHTTLFFADWLMWCGGWAIACGDGPERGKIICYWGLTPTIAADSFGEFIERYSCNLYQAIG